MNKILYSRNLKLRIILYIGVTVSVLVSSAQQTQVYNQFFMNPYVYNPAYAGVDGHPVFYALFKQQWIKIPEGPQLMHATYHIPLKRGVGIGGTVFQDSQGPLSSTSFKASGSYLVNIDRKHFLRFGMSLGLGSNKVTLPEDAIGDPAFAGESNMYLIGDFGVSYHFDHFNAGLALPNLFSSEIITERSLSPFKVSPTDNMLFKMNYRGHINHYMAIEPHLIYRFSNVVPSQYEIATILHLRHLLWVGGTYRQSAGLVGLVGAKFKNKIAVGGAFELGSQNYGDLTGSSFEIQVGIHLGRHKDHERKHIGHHSSFFRTHSDKLLEEKAKEDAIAAQNAINDLTKERDPDVLGNLEQETTGQETTTVATNDPPAVDPQEWNATTESISRTSASGETETGQRLERTNAAGDKEIIMGFAPPSVGGKAWVLAPGASQLLERTRPDGTREVGVKWVRVNENGTFEQTIKWEPIVDEAGADAIASGLLAVANNDPPSEKPDTTRQVIGTSSDPDPPTADPNLPEVDTRTYQELAKSNVHLEVKRGGHALELPAGNHVIGGVFNEFQGAQDESDRLFKRGMRDAKPGYVTSRGHYYVVVGSFSSVAQAQREKGRIKSNYNLKDVWVLKVNK